VADDVVHDAELVDDAAFRAGEARMRVAVTESARARSFG